MKLFVKVCFIIAFLLGSVFAQKRTQKQYDFAQLKSTPKSDAFMQGFYWNVPPGGIWYDSLAKLAPRMASAGFSAIWFPPPEKGAAGGFSMGYDPYDHFDFGEFDQKGSRETRFGSRQELINAINTYHAVGMQVFADAVMRHMNGGEELRPFECKPYPSHPDSSWMLFQYPYGSGRFKKTQADFIPNYQVCDVTPPYHGADDPIFKFGEWICLDKQSVKDSLIVWGLYMRNVLGFDGFRLDAVKNIDPYFMGPWLQYGNPGGYAVAEYFGSASEIGSWLNWTKNVFGGNTAMFDFPLRYTLKDMCNNTDGGFWMTNLDGAGLVNNGVSGFDVSTFVENHDMDRTQYDGTFANGHDPILTNKDMAYSYILFSEGRPCVWFRDYFAYGLDGKIDTLLWIRQNFLYGGTTKRDGLNPYYVGSGDDQDAQSHHIYVARRNGGDGRPESYLVINNHPTEWRGVWVSTGYNNQVFRDFTGRAIDKTSAGDGRVDLWAPPRGYAIYVPNTSISINHPPFVQTIPDLTGFINTPFTYQTQAGDPNNTSVDYSLSGNPSWLSVTSGGLLTGTPATSDSGTTQVVITVTDPLGLSVTDTFSIFVSNHPIMDGVFEGTGIWGAPLAVADTLAGWKGATAKNLYVTEDAQYYYFGADIKVNTTMNWAFLIMSKYGGGSNDSWSRSIEYAHRDLPDYILRGNFNSYAEFHSRDVAWWNGVGSSLNSSEFGENISLDTLQNGWVEGRVLKSWFGNPTGFAIQFYLTGDQNANATFDACPDDSNTTSESGITTRLRNYVKYGTTGISFTNLQYPPSAFINLGGSATVYGRVYAFEITDSTGRGNSINAWFGYDTTDTNPATWANWLPATFNVDVSTLDEYWKTFGNTLPRGIYYYSVRYQLNSEPYLYGGYSANGGGTWDGVNNVSGVLYVDMPPLAPVLTYPAENAVNVPKNVNFQWSSTPGPSAYRLQVSVDSTFATKIVDDSTITTTSKGVSTLSYLTKYYWRLAGKNASGWGAWSALRSFTTVIVFPSAPSLVSPLNNAINQPVTSQLEWSASATATSYYVFVATDTTFAHTMITDTTDTTIYPLNSLSNNTNYFWRIRAVNEGGASPYSSTRKFKTIVAAPDAPTLVSPSPGATNLFLSPKLYWNMVENAETYRLVLATDTNFTTIVYNDSTITDTSKQVSSLSAGTTYFWKVRGKNIGGAGGYSAVRVFSTGAIVSTPYTFEKDWNLISLPMHFDAMTKSELYPSSNSFAFSFEGSSGYLRKDTLKTGLGYWLKFPDAETLSLAGLLTTTDTIMVTAGWNIIGSISSAIDTGDIIQVPPGIIVSSLFRYSQTNGYQSGVTIQPGKAYWVKTSSSGLLIFNQGLAAAKRTKVRKK